MFSQERICVKIVIAPDSFKESLSAIEVACAIEAGFRMVYPFAKYVKIPVADGGEGTVQAMVDATNGHLVKAHVKNPLGKDIASFYGILGDNQTAVIEMAAACGLDLLKEHEKNPFNTSTYGFGELIVHALDKGIRNFIFGLGGSATNDAGVGMLQALGVKFYNHRHEEIGFGAKFIKEMLNIDSSHLDKRLEECTINVACDVTNPLCGPQGASHTFGKQKGATAQMREELDNSLNHFANLCETKFNTQTQQTQGSGAAGGLGFALMTFLHVNLQSGIDVVLKQIHLEEELKDASLVITGEGKMDAQTVYGKTPVGVALLAKKYDIPVIAICGALEEGYETVYEHGIDAVFDTTLKVSELSSVLKNAKQNLQSTSRNIARVLKLQSQIRNS